MAKPLSPAQVNRVMAELDSRGWSQDALVNRVVFVLATLAGLRVSEICALTIGDVDTDRIHVTNGKGGKSRTVPLWHGPARAILSAWRAARLTDGASLDSLYIVTRTGQPMTRQGARKRYLTACRCLDRPPTIHSGRHTYLSLSLAAGVPVTAVRDAAGHASIATTNIYAHTLDDVPTLDLLAR